MNFLPCVCLPVHCMDMRIAIYMPSRGTGVTVLCPPPADMSDFADYISLYMDSAQKYNTDVQPAPYPPPGSSGPSPTYLSSNVDSQSVSQSEFYTPETPYGPNEPPQSSELPEMLLGQSNQQRPPSPARRSMFDYVSPFDALSNSTPQTKRKPVPSQPSGAGSNTDDSS